MSQTFSVLFWLQRSKLNKRGKCPIYIRITIDGARAEIATGKWIEPDRWNSNTGRVRGNSEEARTINEYLQRSWVKITNHHDKFSDEGKLITPALVKNAFLGKLEERRSLINLFEDHNKRLETLVGSKYSKGTWKRYKVSLNHLKSFLEESYGKTDIFLIELEYKFITDYQYYLSSTKGCGNNAALKHIQHLRKIVNQAVNNDWLPKDPFARFKGKREKTERGFLSEVELAAIEDKIIDLPRVKQVKDIFLFACYTGISYSDLAKLSPDNLETDIQGKQWLSFNREKTGNKCSVPIIPKAQALIIKYQGHPVAVSKGLLFPMISNQKTNLYLKELADICGIKKNVTFHLARHTFATTVTLSQGVSIESVSKMLGHRSVKTTEIYAKLADRRVEKEMSRITDMALSKQEIQNEKAGN